MSYSNPAFCNVCGRPIPIRLMKVNEDGLDNLDEKSLWNDDENIETIGMYHTKVWDTRELFPCLCMGCASAIDQALLWMKSGMVHREEILIRNKALNEERKKQLGTNG